MNKKRVGLLLAIAAVVALLLAVAPKINKSVAAAAVDCGIPGSWISTVKHPPEVPTLVMQETLIPLDPAAKRLAYVLRMVNPDATFFGVDPEADYMTELVGEAVKTGRNTYDYSAIGYATKTVPGRNEIRFIWILKGSMACDGDVKTDTASISVYLADQDGDEDGFPDQGAEPVLFVPAHLFSTARRVP